FIAHFLNWNGIVIFFFNFVAIIPLANLLGFATEELSHGIGQGQIRVVQSSLLGSIFSNILLILGSCILAGGITILKEGQLEQEFSSTAAQASSSVMTLACIALIVPAAFSLSITVNMNDPRLKTHKDLFKNEENNDSQISKRVAIFLLIIVTVITAFLSEFLVSSIEGVVTSLGLSKTFIGLILLPIIGNAAEHVSSVTIAMKNKMDFAICISIGSSTVNGKSNWLEGALLLATYIIMGLAFYYYPDN
ncbi:8931_t:CDS:2, partial [Gigaspora margarita]